MVIHIVLFKIKEQATKEQIQAFYENLYKIKENIPGIISISGGNNTSPEEHYKGFTEGFVITFKDKESRDNYLPHEGHQKLIKNYIEPIIKDVLVFDY